MTPDARRVAVAGLLILLVPVGSQVSALLLSVIVAALLSALAAWELRLRGGEPAARAAWSSQPGDAFMTVGVWLVRLAAHYAEHSRRPRCVAQPLARKASTSAANSAWCCQRAGELAH